MGSFSASCTLSDISVNYGDEVRLVFLASCPSFKQEYAPRSMSIRGIYDDYGSIERYEKNSPSILSMINLLKRDLVEKSLGENVIHDLPITKESNFEEILLAVQKHRVEVIDPSSKKTEEERLELENILIDMYKDETEKMKQLLPKDIKNLLARKNLINRPPCLKDVIGKVKREIGDVVNIVGDVRCFIINQVEEGWIKIILPSTFSEQGSKDLSIQKNKIIEALSKDYAVMATGARGRDSYSSEIQVMNKEGIVVSKERDERKQDVKMCFIREDIWNLCKKLNPCIYNRYKKNAKDILDNNHRDKGHKGLNPIHGVCDFDHLQEVGRIHKIKPFSKEQIDEVIENYATLQCVKKEIFKQRKAWRPFIWNLGPQFSNYYEQFEFYTEVSKILKDKAEKEIRE